MSLKSFSGQKRYLKVHALAAVGSGNRVILDPRHRKRIFVENTENNNDPIQISPHFETYSSLPVGSGQLKLKTSELITESDFEELDFLEQFHYRGSKAVSIKNNEETATPSSGGGRSAILLCRLKQGRAWKAIGYIQLTMPLQMCKPRHELFNVPFRHSSRKISWEKWNIDEIKQYVNLIVRIGRVVVSPEFRGLGIARRLISASVDFASSRWQVIGRRPLFMEISAEMLRFVNFVSSSGFMYVGDTEGNQKRIVRDLKSMLRGQKASTGILTLQRKYLGILEATATATDTSVEKLIEEIHQIAENPSKLAELVPEKYWAFKSVLRLPRPYFIRGLDEESQRYIEKNVSIRPIKKRVSKNAACRVQLESVEIACQYDIPPSDHTRLILDSFGLKGDLLSYSLLGPIDIQASGGNIIFVSGPSGSGKSVLLKAIDLKQSFGTLKVRMRNLSKPTDFQTSWMKKIDSELPIIDYLAQRASTNQAIAALNSCGLAEAFSYIKPYRLLSRGQKYRARLADLLLTGSPVWLVDEFCADLDPLSAQIVAHNFRRHVMRNNIIAFVAAANNHHFLSALRPARVIELGHGGSHRILGYREFLDEFYEHHAR